MRTRHLLSTCTAIAAVGIAAAGVTAARAATPEAVSENWSGYAAGASTQFSDVSGSWVQPTAKCNTGGQSYSAFWVGLGGSGQQSQALEQVGTQSDCGSGGQTYYYAWYELVPAAPVKLGLAITPGDKISARVSVSGSSVTVSLTDQTAGQGASKTLQMSDPDTSTAEWIAEAPSACDGSASGNCQPLSLANFGSVAFSNATATANGHSGPISDSNWTAQAVQLSPGSGFASDSSASDGGAQPSALSSDGSSFSVTYLAGAASASGSGDGGYGSSGYGGYGSSGYGGYGGYGSSGYGGDGSSGYGGYGGYGGSYGYGGAGYSYSGYGYDGGGYGYPGSAYG